MPASSSLRLARLTLRAALVGMLLVAAAGTADARKGRNAALIGGLAAGVVGGVALGAALNGAQDNPPPPPPPRPRPVYVEEPVEEVVVRRPRGPICHYERRKVWLDESEFTYKRVEVCE